MDIIWIIKIIQKNLQQQKQENIFPAGIQCQQFGHSIIEKISTLYEEDFMKKFV